LRREYVGSPIPTNRETREVRGLGTTQSTVQTRGYDLSVVDTTINFMFALDAATPVVWAALSGVVRGPTSRPVALVAAEEGTAAVAGEGPSGVPNFENPAASPGEGWEWRGTDEPGSTKGSW